MRLSGYVEAETAQVGVAGGLVVSLGLLNGGDHELPLLNPFAMLQFQVRDHQGFPLRVPTRPPSLLVHRAGGESWAFEGPVPLIAVRKNGQAADPSVLDSRVVRIGAHEEYQASFEIDQFVEETSRFGTAHDQTASASAKISDGTYTVGCIATLIHAEQTQESRIMQADGIEIRFVPRS